MSIRALTAVLVAAVAVNSAIGLYYYLRVVVVLFSRSDEAQMSAQPVSPVPVLAGVALSALTLLLVGLGAYPSPMVRLIEAMVAGRL